MLMQRVSGVQAGKASDLAHRQIRGLQQSLARSTRWWSSHCSGPNPVSSPNLRVGVRMRVLACEARSASLSGSSSRSLAQALVAAGEEAMRLPPLAAKGAQHLPAEVRPGHGAGEDDGVRVV